MEYNQDTRLANVSRMVVTHVYLSALERWWPRDGKRMRVVETFSSTVTYGPFTRDYIHPRDLTFSLAKLAGPLYVSIQFSTPSGENSRSRTPAFAFRANFCNRREIFERKFCFKGYTCARADEGCNAETDT